MKIHFLYKVNIQPQSDTLELFRQKPISWNFKNQIPKCPDLSKMLPPILARICMCSIKHLKEQINRKIQFCSHIYIPLFRQPNCRNVQLIDDNSLRKTYDMGNSFPNILSIHHPGEVVRCDPVQILKNQIVSWYLNKKGPHSEPSGILDPQQ